MRQFDQPVRSVVHAPNGMAATSHVLASQVAVEVLKSGGNAMDAAIAACAVQSVVEPQSTGIGGDCFCMYAPAATANPVAFNGSGRAAAAYSTDWFQERGIDAFDLSSPHSVTIPGAVDAWAHLNADHGRMPLAELLQPAIGYARHGYAVAPRVYFDWTKAKARLMKSTASAAIFLPDGEVPEIGTRHVQSDLADSLQSIADGGRDAFYHGEIAKNITSHLNDLGGVHTQDDFAAAKGGYVTPIVTDFAGVTVHECPPNGQGIAALLLLNMYKHMGVSHLDPLDPQRLHLELEACRLAYRARNIYVADPSMANVPVDEIMSDGYARALVDQIDPDRAGATADQVPLTPHKDTVYISVIDKDRNCASFINTLFHGFGSGITAPNTGIVLHNRGAGFSLDPTHPNRIEGGKRPLHTIIPAMLSQNDKTVMSFGVMGGQYQAFGHLQFLSRHLLDGMDIQEAMDAPRMMVDPVTGVVDIEPRIDADTRAILAAKGHEISESADPIGGSQAIAIDWDNDMLVAGSDPRKDGCAIGY